MQPDPQSKRNGLERARRAHPDSHVRNALRVTHERQLVRDEAQILTVVHIYPGEIIEDHAGASAGRGRAGARDQVERPGQSRPNPLSVGDGNTRARGLRDECEPPIVGEGNVRKSGKRRITAETRRWLPSDGNGLEAYFGAERQREGEEQKK